VFNITIHILVFRRLAQKKYANRLAVLLSFYLFYKAATKRLDQRSFTLDQNDTHQCRIPGKGLALAAGAQHGGAGAAQLRVFSQPVGRRQLEVGLLLQEGIAGRRRGRGVLDHGTALDLTGARAHGVLQGDEVKSIMNTPGDSFGLT